MSRSKLLRKFRGDDRLQVDLHPSQAVAAILSAGAHHDETGEGA